MLILTLIVCKNYKNNILSPLDYKNKENKWTKINVSSPNLIFLTGCYS